MTPLRQRVSEDMQVRNLSPHSLVENVRAIVRLAPALNLMDDPRIAELCADIVRNLTVYDPEQLRSSEALRESVANEADAILKRMQGAFV
jgi:hypothetical protein